MIADDFEYDHRFASPCEENLIRLELSRQEAAGLTRREIKCPVCSYRIMSAYTTEGCVKVKCRRGKVEGIISLRWVRRQKSSFRNRW